MAYKTVQDLIDALQEVDDKSLGVRLEGCDCTNDWNGNIVYDTEIDFEKEATRKRRVIILEVK